MPRDAFFKLKDTKQEVILQAARNEFARKEYDDVSINQIVKNANVSRGSFYQYFVDKDDLYSYLLRVVRDDIYNTFIEALQSRKTIFEVGQLLFDKFMFYYHREDKDFSRKIALNLTPKIIINFVYAFDNANPLIFTKVGDYRKLNITTAEDFQVLIESIISYMCEKACEVFIDYTTEDEARKNVINFLDHLKIAYYK